MREYLVVVVLLYVIYISHIIMYIYFILISYNIVLYCTIKKRIQKENNIILCNRNYKIRWKVNFNEK